MVSAGPEYWRRTRHAALVLMAVTTLEKLLLSGELGGEQRREVRAQLRDLRFELADQAATHGMSEDEVRQRWELQAADGEVRRFINENLHRVRRALLDGTGVEDLYEALYPVRGLALDEVSLDYTSGVPALPPEGEVGRALLGTTGKTTHVTPVVTGSDVASDNAPMTPHTNGL